VRVKNRRDIDQIRLDSDRLRADCNELRADSTRIKRNILSLQDRLVSQTERIIFFDGVEVRTARDIFFTILVQTATPRWIGSESTSTKSPDIPSTVCSTQTLNDCPPAVNELRSWMRIYFCGVRQIQERRSSKERSGGPQTRESGYKGISGGARARNGVNV